MDALDFKIVQELQQNGRLTNQELSERINLSPSPCLRRLKKLEKDGVIHGYTALVDQEKYGLDLDIFVQVKLERSTQDLIDVFEKHVDEIDEILECYLITGTSDYLLHIVSENLKTYEKFMRERMTQIPGIANLETSISFGTVKKKHAFPKLRR